MARTPIKKTDVTDIPSVVRYEEAKSLYNRFKEQHSDLWEELSALAEELNTAAEQAEQDIRAKQTSCGDWQIQSIAETYDASKLFDLLGREKFLAMGGSITTKSVYELDKKKVEAFAASKQIPPEVVKEVYKTTPRYAAPKKVVLP